MRPRGAARRWMGALVGFDEASYKKTLGDAGFSAGARKVNFVGAVTTVVWLLILVGMVYGPMGRAR